MVTSYKPPTAILGKRLRAARLAREIPQDRLGVMAGLDEGSASARISRYESGTHEPPISFAQKLAEVLNVPSAYFYATDETLAALILDFHRLPKSSKNKLLLFLTDLK